MDSTLLKGLSILEQVAKSDRPRGVTELAEQMGLGKSSVHRALTTLAHAGYIRNDTTGRYRPTLKLWELGYPVLMKLDLRQIAQREMRRLADESRETVHLSVLDGAEVVYLDKIESPEPIRAYTSVGGRAPAHAVATGKALLAWALPETIQKMKLQRFTADTIASAAALSSELARIRQQGFAVNQGEWRETVAGIASPIRNGSGDVVAAIGISGPRDRIDADRVATFSPWIVTSAGAISRDLGYKEISA